MHVHIYMGIAPRGLTGSALVCTRRSSSAPGTRLGRPRTTKCEQCEDGKVYVERVRGSDRGFEHLTKGDMIVSQDGHAFLCFASRCSSLSYSSILSRTSRGSGCILALCLCFSFCASLFLTRSHYSFLPFWRRHDNETSAATALETINLRKCTQVFVNRTFNCIPDVCAQATPLIAFLKQDRSWGHTPPTESRSARSVASLAKALSKNSEQANWKLHSSQIEIGGDHRVNGWVYTPWCTVQI